MTADAPLDPAPASPPGRTTAQSRDRERRTDVSHPSPERDVRDERLHVLVAVAIVRNERVLVMREEGEPHRHAWVLPQGEPQPNESLRDTAVREIDEELGLSVTIDGLVGLYEEFVNESDRTGVHRITICYRGECRPGDEPRPSREASEFAWIRPEVGISRAPSVIRQILSDLAKSGG